MAAIPSFREEDAKRPSRERESLVGEQSRLVNRMKATLIRHLPWSRQSRAMLIAARSSRTLLAVCALP
jgi:hypothetical protein